MRTPRSAAALVVAVSAAAGLASAAVRADVLVVDNSFGMGADYFTLPTAVNAAADGDVLVVRGSTTGESYAGFTVSDKALTLVADPVEDFFGETHYPEIHGQVRFENLAAGKLLTFSGFSVESELLPFSAPPGLEIVDCAGEVVVEDSIFFGGTTSAPAMAIVRDSDAVTLLRCTIEGVDGLVGNTPGVALRAERSTVRLFESGVSGGDGVDAFVQGIAVVPATAGRNGITLLGGSLYTSGCTLTGGHGGTGTLDLFGSCWPSAAGGDGVQMMASGAAPPSFTRLDSPASGGTGGTSVDVGCGAAADGVGVRVDAGSVLELTESARGLEIGSPLRAGETTTLVLRGEPGDAALLFYGTSVLPLTVLDWNGPIYPSPLTFQLIGAVPGSGELGLPVTFQNVPVPSVSIWLQAIHVPPTLDRAVVGSPGLLLLLDE